LQGINGNQGSSGLVVGAAPLNDGQWHLLTLVNYLEGATWRSRVYYDNGTTFTQFNTGGGGRVSNLLRIGDTSRGGNPWRGQIDDLRIYRRALSQAEVATIYSAPDSETFSDWLATNLTPGQQAVPALASPLGDVNSNGVSNIVEFAVGGAVVSPLQVQITNSPWNWTTLLTLNRNSLARGITMVVEGSSDFVNWTPIATSINGTPFAGSATINEGGGTVRPVTIATPMPGVATFYRLRVLGP
ncbi:MAG TPA: LamG-like jellyroll fold domain-containing protein, partial [Roseimicrobium sp.]|nr:LamG-like jellyroll fold domain-containing protein [Roseimicrobium sp.]